MRSVTVSMRLLVGLTMLFACSPLGENSVIDISPSPDVTSTSTPIPATAIPPTATPEFSLITSETVGGLSIYLSFGQGESLRSLAFSPDSKTIVSAGGNREDFDIRLWDAAGGQLLQTLQGHSGIVWSVAFSPDGSLMASASKDKTVKVWDMTTGSLLRSLDFPNEIVSVRFSPDNQTLAVGGVDEWPKAAIWTFSVSSWELEMKLAEFWSIPDLAYTPDGLLLIGGGTSRNVRVWRTSDGVEEHILYHSGQVSSVASSPDGSIAATGLCEASDESAQCYRGAVWLWDLQNGNLIRNVADFSNWVTAVDYSLDGSVLIAGSRDGTYRAYSTSDFQTLLLFSSPGGGGILALSPNGRLLATTGANGIINIWRVSP